MSADVMSRGTVRFPASMADFQWCFPDDAACATWLERLRWPGGFVCPHCGEPSNPVRFPNRPEFLHCRSCGRNLSLTEDSVMAGTMTPLAVWFLAAYMVAENARAISVRRFCDRLGLERYDIAADILRKLRGRLQDAEGGRIGRPVSRDRVEVDVEWIDAAEGGAKKRTLVAAAVEVLRTENGEPMLWGGHCVGRLKLQTISNSSPETMCTFIETAVWPGTDVAARNMRHSDRLTEHGFALPANDAAVAGADLAAVRLVFDNLKGWLREGDGDASGIQSRLDEFAFRFNRRFSTFAIFRSLLGIDGDAAAPIYRELSSEDWKRSAAGRGV
jgi:hypothetical protein